MQLFLFSEETNRDWPRRATFFFCFAKKEGKKGDPVIAAPSGCPKVPRSKREVKQTRLRLRQVSLLFPF
jgi:hypothetical protein